MEKQRAWPWGEVATPPHVKLGIVAMCSAETKEYVRASAPLRARRTTAQRLYDKTDSDTTLSLARQGRWQGNLYTALWRSVWAGAH